MTNDLYVDVQILQDVPPSNINRDDSGTPKQAVYGGVRRLRVSSQAWKRATRLNFIDMMGFSSLGVRTRRFVSLLKGELIESGVVDDLAERLSVSTAKALGIGASKKDSDLAYLLFFGRPQLREISRRILDRVDELADLSEKELDDATAGLGVLDVLGTGHSLDVALFGRMVADLNDLNVDAASQVAHAISTHAAATEFDYFTAVDDNPTEEMKAGAGMIGLVEFNSATLYRYATVSVSQLLENLGDRDATVEGVASFIKAFALSMPAGHKNSFAPRTRPGLVLVSLRSDQPVNLVSAFEEPILGGTHGTLAPSMVRLANFVKEEAVRWGDKPNLTVASYRNIPDPDGGAALAGAFGESLPLEDLVEKVSQAVRSWLES